LEELSYAHTLVIPITLRLDFDPDWQRFYKELSEQYGKPLDKLLKSSS